LAEAWKAAGGQTAIVTHDTNGAIERRIRLAGIRWEPFNGLPPDQAVGRALDAFADSSSPPPWVVVDGEPFVARATPAIRERGVRVLVIDDRAEPPHYQADAILNPSLDASWWNYPTEGGTVQLLGPRYGLLAPEFTAWQAWKRVTPRTASKVLVMPGSFDAWRAIQREGIRDLESQIARVDHLADQMAWGDVAVSVGASSWLESAFMQLPTLTLVSTDRELSLVRRLEQAHIVESLGWVDRVTDASIVRSLSDFCRDFHARQFQSREGRQTVDGQGARRVAALLRAVDESPPGEPIELRRVDIGDLAALWRMSNEPSILRTALDDGASSLAQFGDWFERRLADSESRSWVLDFHGQILAHVRYDRRDRDHAEIAIAVHPLFRRRGLATSLLDRTRRIACEELGVSHLRAVIRQENAVSQHLFRKASFTLNAHRVLENKSCCIYDLHC